MAELLNGSTFSEKIYNTFPEVYRREDKYQKYALKRYINTAGEGFKAVIEETNGVMDLKDADKVSSKFLSALFASHGLDIFNGLPEVFLRNLLPMLNTSFSRKGSISSVEYVCSVVSGVVCHVDVSNFKENNRLDVVVDMDTTNEKRFPSVEQLRRIVKEFVPFYCNVYIVFSFNFREDIRFIVKDSGIFDEILDRRKSSIYLNAQDLLEQEIKDQKLKESSGLFSDLYENTDFMDCDAYLLSENFCLSSDMGYDTIIINGKRTINTYNL